VIPSSIKVGKRHNQSTRKTTQTKT